ncbi:MAG: hypothetical protein D6756_11605 [Cyanobacteria bacterium J083]|nr:MAG: hypothetical protein D6756_11605 [Cyanobacteria bacterium J083]
MLGKFQQSYLRIELDAKQQDIYDSLRYSANLKKWLWPQEFDSMSERLSTGVKFNSRLGLIEIEHQVAIAGDNCLRFILSKAIDGYHEWYWGDGWVQSRLEGISVLPLNLAQTYSLLRLRQHLQSHKTKQATSTDSTTN